MNDLESLFTENMRSNTFHEAINDVFDFVDELTDESDKEMEAK